MSEIAEERKGRKRKPRVSTGSAGEHLVISELKKRGFDAELAAAGSKARALLVWKGDSPPKPIQVKTVHSTPWYVRRASFVGSLADQVTVLVLLGLGMKSARFFVAMNRDLAVQLRQPPTWKAYGFIDAKTVEKYEGNWDVLR